MYTIELDDLIEIIEFINNYGIFTERLSIGELVFSLNTFDIKVSNEINMLYDDYFTNKSEMYVNWFIINYNEKFNIFSINNNYFWNMILTEFYKEKDDYESVSFPTQTTNNESPKILYFR